MKKQSARKIFSDVFEFKKEFKSYRKLIRGKSKEYTFYSEWEDHIKKCIGAHFRTKEQLYDFKQYCVMRRDWLQSISPSGNAALVAIFSAMITILLTTNNQAWLGSEKMHSAPFFVQFVVLIVLIVVIVIPIALFIIAMMVSVINVCFLNELEINFYNRLIEIVESCEAQSQKSIAKVTIKQRKKLVSHQRSVCASDD